MQPTINNIKTRLANIAKLVTGIKRAYAEAPMSLPPSDLPVFCSFTGPVLSFETLSAQTAIETRQFICRLYGTQIQQGYDGNAEKLVEPFITSMRDVFLSHPGMGLETANTRIEFVSKLSWLGDGGILID